MLNIQIASKLEKAFSEFGFAEPSVAQLKTACDVSLRTLYKYYPSKDDMIIAALEYRHQRYLNLITDHDKKLGVEATQHLILLLQQWMLESAPNGCLSMQAKAAFPCNKLIEKTVTAHKLDVQRLLGEQSLRPDLSTQLFLIHEGVSSAWPLLGEKAVSSALQAISTLLQDNNS